MYLMVAKRSWQVAAVIPKILLEYSKLYLFFSNKIYIANVNFCWTCKYNFQIFHFWTLFLQLFKLSISLQSSSSMSHTFGPKYETLSLLWYTELTSGFQNFKTYLKLYRLLTFCVKISFIIGSDRFLLSRNISIARDSVFLMWIKTEPSISSSLENCDCWSL